MSFNSKFTIFFMVGLVIGIFMSNPFIIAVSVLGFLFSQPHFSGRAADINYDIVGACERIRKEAETLAGKNYAFNLQRKTGALDFITSPENGSVDTKLISYQAGSKIADLTIFYDQRTKPCQINTHRTNICDDGSTPVRKSFNTRIDNYLSTPIRDYSNDDMVALCENTEEFMRKRGFSDLRAAREKFSELILAELDAQVGKNYEHDGTTTAAGDYKLLDLVGTDNGQHIPLPGNFAEMLLDYENNQLTGVPAVIGQGNFDLFWKLHGMSCCNATTPYGDENINGDVRFYKDQAANNILDPNRVILAAFGAVHLVYFNENRNIMINSPTVKHLVIPDPAGYPFDWNLDFKWDECNKVWKMNYSILWGTFNLFQADSFAASGEDTSPDMSPDCTDERDGVLGLFGYNIS